jgi:hypothetical protein
MGIAYDYSMAVLLAVLGLLSVGTLILGVVGVVTGRSYSPTLIWRLRRRRTPASAEDERLLGMSITLMAVFGLLMTLQIGALAIVISTGLRSPRTPAFELATLIGLLVVFCVDLLLIGSAAAIGFRVRYVVGRPNRLSAEADPGAQST